MTFTRTPTTTNEIATCHHLTDLLCSGIITEVGCLPTKGGSCDNNGRVSYRQGGGNRTESLRRDRKANATPQGVARPQGQQCVAHSCGSVQGVETAVGSIGKTGSGKLNSSSVARCDSGKIEALAQTAVRSRYLVAILHASAENGKGGCRRDSI